jgi:hypothetical protein
MTKFCPNCGTPHEERGLFCKEKGCHKDFRRKKRNERAEKHCRLCARPGSPEEWARFRRWRKAEQKELDRVLSGHSKPQESLHV